MGVELDQLTGLLATTLANYPKQKLEVAWTNQRYEFCRIYQEDRMVVDGGTSIKRKIMLSDNGNAAYRLPFDTDTPNVQDDIQEIDVPWCLIGTHYSWDEFELLNQKNSAKGFIDLLETRRIGGLWSLADLIESAAWRTPTSATDKKEPYGVPYYFNVLNSDGTINTSAGFNGATISYRGGTTGTLCAGIDAATEAKWRNYCAPYTKVDANFVKEFRVAMWNTQFKAPLFISSKLVDDSAMQKRGYCSVDIASDIAGYMDAKDDNHSNKDLVSGIKLTDTGGLMVHSVPIIPIPQLTDADYDPIYVIDFDKFQPVVHDGYWMEEKKPKDGGTSQHTVLTVFLDGAHQNLLLNRKTGGFVLHKTTA